MEELKDLGEYIYQNTGALIEDGNKPFAIAAIYIMIALQIYKTMLSEDDFNAMVDSISDSRDQVKKLSDLSPSIMQLSNSVH
jgi:prophage maintenance system killer protein